MIFNYHLVVNLNRVETEPVSWVFFAELSLDFVVTGQTVVASSRNVDGEKVNSVMPVIGLNSNLSTLRCH